MDIKDRFTTNSVKLSFFFKRQKIVRKKAHQGGVQNQFFLIVKPYV